MKLEIPYLRAKHRQISNLLQAENVEELKLVTLDLKKMNKSTPIPGANIHQIGHYRLRFPTDHPTLHHLLI
jgi:hypothetical protein